MSPVLLAALLIARCSPIAVADTEKTRRGEVDVALSNWHEADRFVSVHGTVLNKSELPISGQSAIQYFGARHPMP